MTTGFQLIYSFDFYELAPNTVYRQYANLQDTTAPGSTNQLVSMGINNTLTASSDGGDRYMVRILGFTPPAVDPDGGPGNTLGGTASAYFKMNDFAVATRTSGWHNLKAVLSTNDGLSTDYNFYVDSVLAETVNDVGTAAQIRQYDNIRMGSGVSSTADAYYDNFHVEYIAVTSPGVEGDYNGDGIVNAADYVLWKKGVNPLTNEVTGVTPGSNTAEDYDAWKARFGNISGSGSGLGAGIFRSRRRWLCCCSA